MKNVIFWSTLAAAAIAAWLMYRRGENLTTIARETTQHPVGSFVREAQRSVS